MAGRIFKRGDTLHIAFSYKGVEYRKSALTNKKRDAEQLLSFYLGQCARDAFTGFGRATTYTLVEMVNDYVDDYAQRGMRDVQNTRYRIRHLTDFFPTIAAAEVEERQIDLYIKHRLKQGKKRGTVNRELSLLMSAFRLAKRKKLVPDIPHIALFRERNARQGFFEQEELERLVLALPLYLKDVARFAYHTGWRKREIFTLEWRDVQGDVIRLRPEIAKNKDGRVILLVGEIGRILARRQVAQLETCPYIFHRDGKRIISHYRAWYKACAAAGLKGRHLHDNRRTAARNMDRVGVPRQVAKQIIGHKTDDLYNRYRIVNEQDIREGMQQAEAYLANLGHHTDS